MARLYICNMIQTFKKKKEKKKRRKKNKKKKKKKRKKEEFKKESCMFKKMSYIGEGMGRKEYVH